VEFHVHAESATSIDVMVTISVLEDVEDFTVDRGSSKNSDANATTDT